MEGRIPVEGLSHGDIVRLTGSSWEYGGFDPNVTYEVDDKTFHRPVIYDNRGGVGSEWYIMEKMDDADFSVTKVGQ